MDRVGVDLALLDRLLALRLTVEAYQHHLPHLARLLDCGVRAECGRVVDREDADQIGRGLECVAGRLVADVLRPIAVVLVDDDDLCFGRCVVRLEDLAEALHPQPAGFELLGVQNRHLAPRP